MPDSEVLDAIEPYERLYEPELDKLEIEEDYSRDDTTYSDYFAFWDEYDVEMDCD